MERIAVHTLGLFRTVPNVVACPENRRGRACGGPDRKGWYSDSQGLTNQRYAVPDRQGIATHAVVI
jgi:hypothetical protein